MRNWPRWPAPSGADPAKLRARAVRAAGRRTRCWAIAAAAWASPFPKSTRCRRARFSKPPRKPAGGVQLEIMIPLVGFKSELDMLKDRIAAVAVEVEKERGKGDTLSHRHHDRAAARRIARRRYRRDGRILFLRHQRSDADHAGRIARRCRKFSGRIPAKGLIARDPFVSIDTDGVGELVKIAARTRPRVAAQAETRDLRRTRRRSRNHRLLPERRDWITCRARLIGCRSRDSPRRRRH